MIPPPFLLDIIMERERNIAAELDYMERLAEVMNNTPKRARLGGTEFEITALKPGTQMLIAEEACRIAKAEKAHFSDVVKQFAVNVPSVIKVLTLAILNDRDRIYSDARRKVFSDEYYSLYSTIEWETNPKEWMGLLVDVLQLLSMDFFWNTSEMIETFKTMTLTRKMTKKEQESSSQEQNGVK